MLYAFKLGPVETREGFFTTYVGVTPDKMLPPIFAARATDALRSLAERAEGRELGCEPSLARIGKAIGFEPMKAPEWVAIPRAMLAFGLALGNGGGQLLGAPILEFLTASAGFMKAKPWRHWNNGDIVDVQVSGLRDAHYEASIMGGGGLEYGVALYEEKGAMEKVKHLFEEGRIPDASSLRSIAVTMNDEPAWAIKAVKDAFGLARVPHPIRVANGAPGPVDAMDLATLATALRAVARLTPRRTETIAGLEVNGSSRAKGGDLQVSARVRGRESI